MLCIVCERLENFIQPSSVVDLHNTVHTSATQKTPDLCQGVVLWTTHISTILLLYFTLVGSLFCSTGYTQFDVLQQTVSKVEAWTQCESGEATVGGWGPADRMPSVQATYDGPVSVGLHDVSGARS